MVGWFTVAIILIVGSVAAAIFAAAAFVDGDPELGVPVLFVIIFVIPAGLGMFHYATATEARCWAAHQGHIVAGECVTIEEVE